MEQEEQQRRRSRRGRGSHRRYAQPNSNFAPSLDRVTSRYLYPVVYRFSLSLSGSAESANAAAENKDREVIIAMVTKAVTAITQRLTSLSTFDGTDSKVRTSTHLPLLFLLARAGWPICSQRLRLAFFEM